MLFIVMMHELGHALSIGWADDAPIPDAGFLCEKCYEVYSRKLNRRSKATEEEVWGSFTDPWDPDTDDDGLTDGQEIWGLPVGEKQHSWKYPRFTTVEIDTSPTLADSDNDGWWDGWIGVYDVGRTDNVVLYREHLLDEDLGIQPDEVVQEQIGIHEGSEAPIGRGVNIDSDPELEHSNIHIGELHWGTDPDDISDTPAEETTLSVEVDFHKAADARALSQLDAVEENYLLYGLDVSLTHDQNLTNDDLKKECTVCDSDLPPISLDDARDIEDRYHGDNSKLYMLITTKGGWTPPKMKSWKGDVDGVASSDGFNNPTDVPYVSGGDGLGFGIMIFTKDHTEGQFKPYVQKTIMHEIGHHIGLGRADDHKSMIVLPIEIYSGSTEDSTPEIVNVNGNTVREWSVMSSGWEKDAYNVSNQYFVFSLEELFTTEFEEIDTVDD